MDIFDEINHGIDLNLVNHFWWFGSIVRQSSHRISYKTSNNEIGGLKKKKKNYETKKENRNTKYALRTRD